MPIMYVESVVDGMLKGLNQQVSSLKYMLLDSSSRIVLILFLVPSRGMEGFLFIMVLSNLLTCFLNTHRLLSVTGMKLKWSTWILKPVLAMCTGAASVLLLIKATPLHTLPRIWILIIGGVLAAGLYCLLLPLLGCTPGKICGSFVPPVGRSLQKYREEPAAQRTVGDRIRRVVPHHDRPAAEAVKDGRAPLSSGGLRLRQPRFSRPNALSVT